MLKKIFVLFILLTQTGCGGLDSLFYVPDQHVYTTPKADGYPYEDVTFKSADGTRLHGWFIPSSKKAMGIVIHFHGNAQNMSAHYSFVSWLPAAGFNLFVFDYRGYGQSEGQVSRQGVYEDGVAAMKHIKSRSDIDQEKLIVFGQSIGGATALAVVGENNFKGIAGVATDSAFSTYKGVASDHAGILKPFAYLCIGNKHSPERSIHNIAPTPLLLIHGTADRVVPYKHAEKLLKAAEAPKELWTIPNAGHTAPLGTHAPEYVPRLHRQFVTWVSSEQFVMDTTGSAP